MDQDKSEHVALFGMAPSLRQLRQGQYPFTVYSPEAPEPVETLQLTLPDAVGHRLLMGRLSLMNASTDYWAVYGEREGETLRPEKITEYVYGGREGVEGHVLWQRDGVQQEARPGAQQRRRQLELG